MTQDAGLQEAEYAYERISAERGALVRKGYCVHGWLQENGDGTQTCLAGCRQTFPDFETAMNAKPLRFEGFGDLIIAVEARGELHRGLSRGVPTG